MQVSGQIIATSHDLTPNGGLVREIPLFQGNLGWWNILICAEVYGTFEGLKPLIVNCLGLVSYNDHCYTKKKHLEHGEVSVWTWKFETIFFLFHVNLARFQFQRCILSCTFQSILNRQMVVKHTTQDARIVGSKILTNWDSSSISNACRYVFYISTGIFVNHPFRTRTHTQRSLAAYINGYGANDFTASLLTNIPKFWSLNPWASMAKPIRILRRWK